MPVRDRINLSEDYKVEYWIQKFGVNIKNLRAAVKGAGGKAKDVEAFLRKSKK